MGENKTDEEPGARRGHVRTAWLPGGKSWSVSSALVQLADAQLPRRTSFVSPALFKLEMLDFKFEMPPQTSAIGLNAFNLCVIYLHPWPELPKYAHGLQFMCFSVDSCRFQLLSTFKLFIDLFFVSIIKPTQHWIA